MRVLLDLCNEITIFLERCVLFKNYTTIIVSYEIVNILKDTV